MLVICYNALVVKGQKRYSESCETNDECDTGLCNPTKKVCVCHGFVDYSIGQKLEQVYMDGGCYSKVHQMCTFEKPNYMHRILRERNGWRPITCIRNAVCVPTNNGIGSKKDYGKCMCGAFWVENINGTRCQMPVWIQPVRSRDMLAPEPVTTEIVPILTPEISEGNGKNIIQKSETVDDYIKKLGVLLEKFANLFKMQRKM